MAKVLVVGWMTFILCPLFPNQREKKEERRFVVGFELSAEKGMILAWPLEAMPASGYRSVLMVVEKMPRIYKEEGARKFWEYLSVYRHLRVNGQALPAGNSAQADALTYPREFVVDLREGRLLLSLTIPPGRSIDPQHKTAVIKLFEVPPRDPVPASPSMPQDERREEDLPMREAGNALCVSRQSRPVCEPAFIVAAVFALAPLLCAWGWQWNDRS